MFPLGNFEYIHKCFVLFLNLSGPKPNFCTIQDQHKDDYCMNFNIVIAFDYVKTSPL